MTSPTFELYGRYVSQAEQRQLAEPPPTVSIVTVSLNAANTIERTILSVQSQSYAPIEQIFIDGGSVDGTGDIIRKHARARDYCVVEPDKGISDAFNKGVALSRGRYLQILNADDWLSPNQIENAVTCIEQTGADF